MKSMPTKSATTRTGSGLISQPSQTRLHGGASRQDASQAGALPLHVSEGFQQIKHAAALGVEPLPGVDMPAQSQRHGTIGAQLRQVELRVASRQINTVDRGQFTVS